MFERDPLSVPINMVDKTVFTGCNSNRFPSFFQLTEPDIR